MIFYLFLIFTQCSRLPRSRKGEETCYHPPSLIKPIAIAMAAIRQTCHVARPIFGKLVIWTACDLASV